MISVNIDHEKYECLRMSFDLKNAPATFQRVMDMLRNVPNSSLKEHINNLKQV